MQYQIGDWLVNTIETSITHLKTQERAKLEPIATELLTLLAENSGQIVTREELFEKIWNGRVISDHAIYRVITKLRKALSPNDKNAYIVTVPKRGYKLVQEYKPLTSVKTSEIDNNQKNGEEKNNQDLKITASPISKATTVARSKIYLIIISIALVGLSFFALSQITKKDNFPYFTESIPLTSQIGIETDPILIRSDNSLLIYSHGDRNSNQSDIFIKNLKTEAITQITFNTEKYHYNNLTASNNGKIIAAVKYNKNQCNIVLIELNNKNEYLENQLFPCKSKFTDLALTNDGEKLYYIQSTASENRHIFLYSIKTSKIEQISKINQNKSLGEFVIALSPDNKHLAFVRYIDWENTELGIIDLDSLEEKSLLYIKGITRDIAWSNDNKKIFYLDTAKSIQAYSLQSNATQPVAKSITESLQAIATHSETNAIAVVTEEIVENRGIWKYPNPEILTDNTPLNTAPIIGSNTIDISPNYANNSDRIAFVSLRNGLQQIWLKEIDGIEKKLSSFTDGRHIRRLAWSPDDNYLLSDSNNEIFSVNSVTGETQTIIAKDSLGSIGGAVWANDGKSIYFSSNQSDDWQIYNKALASNEIKQITQKGGRAAFVSKKHPDTLFFLKANKDGLWKINVAAPNNSEELLFSNIDDTSHAGVIVRNEKIYYASKDSEIKVFNLNTQTNYTLELNQVPAIPQFTISQDESSILFVKQKLIDTSIILLSEK